MTADAAFVAYHRFGLGPRPDDMERAPADMRAALVAELAPAALRLAGDLPDSRAAYGTLRDDQMARAERRAEAAPAMAEGAAGMAMKNGPSAAHRLYRAELAARLDRVGRAQIGFVDRLVMFWANHFAVQASKGELVRGLAGAFEREAIRPHVLGRFSDMLLAATTHPAMLVSLDNVLSVGPASPAGRRRDRGLNENHARELLELHTVGGDGGYTQDDVVALAKILTGWSFVRDVEAEDAGRFVFEARAHEPGTQTVLGRRYAQEGRDQGEAVLRDLAGRPETARHIALKFARAFVADDPPAGLVERLAGRFTDTGGDLASLARALVEDEEAWTGRDKFKTPQLFIWSALRALDAEVEPQMVIGALQALGQPLWDPPSPEGFHDDRATWLAPDAITTRLEIAERLAGRAAIADEPADWAQAIFGATLSADTATAIARAESERQAFVLALMSPEFQRS
ncbi:DUF1800 domain-containing protein [Prosthecomicrobium pneumaticum]|uniref:Uncharacterized protein (DUF1800 family) n=1 Tax=Prosthecomicrobium pneumaticum TaxID=81895 RepID=A0A7W9CUA1_9HYPH|nr:DUF1800 domain-containing protein [Prosthecomicrobium pneumaticum]MBB5751502.1 uncharacterized protein (DUF1800 family) [Prosthecomicrobium pneumaticum]